MNHVASSSKAKLEEADIRGLLAKAKANLRARTDSQELMHLDSAVDYAARAHDRYKAPLGQATDFARPRASISADAQPKTGKSSAKPKTIVTCETDPVPQRMNKQEKKMKHTATLGPKWFNMPAPELTAEAKREFQALHLRNYLDPKRHYKKFESATVAGTAAGSAKPGAKGSKKKDHPGHVPKFFAFGRIVADKSESSTASMGKKEKRETIVEELMADTQAKSFAKRKFKEINASRMAPGRGGYTALKRRRERRY